MQEVFVIGIQVALLLVLGGVLSMPCVAVYDTTQSKLLLVISILFFGSVWICFVGAWVTTGFNLAAPIN